MSVIRPGSSNHSSYSSHQPISTRAKAILAVIAISIIALKVVSGDGFGDVLVAAVLAPIFGSAIGAYFGFFIGFGGLAHFFSWILIPPVALAGILGALGGAVTAWMLRVFDVKNKLAKSFVSSLFSPEIWEGNATSFLCKLLASAVVGYVVAAGFSSIGVFDAGTSNFGMFAGGGGSGFAADPFNWIMVLFAMLVVVLVAGGIIGGGTGGMVGAIIGAGFSSIGTGAVIAGAAEGTAFRFFAPYRPKELRSSWLIYLLVGAGTGIAESILIGAGVGMILYIARVVGILA